MNWCIFRVVLIYIGFSSKLSDFKIFSKAVTQHDIEKRKDSITKSLSDNKAISNKRFDESDSGIEDDETIGFLRNSLTDKEIVDNIGEPEERSRLTEWGADGMFHQTWFYKSKGIELDLVKEEGKLVVDMITINSPCVYQTKEGIGIGSSRKEVLSAYTKQINTEDSRDNSIVVGSVYGGIIFSIKDGLVSSIFIGAAAE